jgi:hypothetical protein
MKPFNDEKLLKDHRPGLKNERRAMPTTVEIVSSQTGFGIGVSPCAEVEPISSCGFVSGINEAKKGESTDGDRCQSKKTLLLRLVLAQSPS